VTVNELKLRARARIEFLIQRDGKVCRIPGCKNPTVFNEKNRPTTDHIHPLSKGGPDTPDNWQLSHEKCNQMKADRLILEDGTLEPIFRKTKPQKIAKKDPCQECMEGRLLLEGETCPVCEIGPQPVTFPKYLQREAKDCDHSYYHCRWCVIGVYERTPASSDVFGLDEEDI